MDHTPPRDPGDAPRLPRLPARRIRGTRHGRQHPQAARHHHRRRLRRRPPSCDDLETPIAEEIFRLSPSRVVAVGGEAAVCDDVISQALGLAQAR